MDDCAPVYFSTFLVCHTPCSRRCITKHLQVQHELARSRRALALSVPQLGMTAPILLACISLAILGQLALGIFVAIRGRGASEAPILSSRTVQAAWQGLRAFRVDARTFEDPSHSQCSFRLVPVDGDALPRFQPGQFLTFVVPIAGVSDGDARAVPIASLTRCYSLSDAPRDDAYRITVKRAQAPLNRPDIPVGIVSNYFHDHVVVGTTVEARAPSGQFVIDPDPSVPVVLIGGGIGVTPLLSMLLWVLAEQPRRHITLFLGVRSGADHAFKAVLRDLAASHQNFDLHVLYNSPEVDDVEGRDFTHRGVITLGLLEPLVSAGRCTYYVCGPSPMMELIVPGLAAAGVESGDIHFEAFGPASVRRGPDLLSAPSSRFEVQFRHSGRTVTWDGAAPTLLDFAESNGITIEAGCRSGSCGTCETRLVQGTIGYPEVPAYDVTAGFCLPCVGVPQSAVVLDA